MAVVFVQPVSLHRCDRAWQRGAQGHARYDDTLRIVDASDKELVGYHLQDLPKAVEEFASAIEHVRRFPGEPLTIRRLWHNRVWESTYTAVSGYVDVAWTCLCVIPTDAAESMSQWLAAARSVSAALAGDDSGSEDAQAERVPRCSERRPRLRAV